MKSLLGRKKCEQSGCRDVLVCVLGDRMKEESFAGEKPHGLRKANKSSIAYAAVSTSSQYINYLGNLKLN